MMLILVLLLFILFLLLLIGGRIFSALLGLFVPPFKANSSQKEGKKSASSAPREKVDMEEVNLRRFDKDQGEYVDFEEERRE